MFYENIKPDLGIL